MFEGVQVTFELLEAITFDSGIVVLKSAPRR